MKPSKKQPEESRARATHDDALSEEELSKVAGGTRDALAEQQVNIGDLPNVRVDTTPM